MGGGSLYIILSILMMSSCQEIIPISNQLDEEILSSSKTNYSFNSDQTLVALSDPCVLYTPLDCNNYTRTTFTGITISMPGVCDLLVSYDMVMCDQGGLIVYTIENLVWTWKIPDCLAYLTSVWLPCSVASNPAECYDNIMHQVELDLNWYILDQFMISLPVATISDCNSPPFTVAGRYFIDLCKKWCIEFDANNQIIFSEQLLCGSGCCEQGSYYCKDSNGDIVRQSSWSDNTQVNCGTIPAFCNGLTTECIEQFCPQDK